LGQPLYLPRENEACALGSALVAAVHTGHYRDLNEAARQMVQMAGVVEPRPETKRIYDACYDRYVATYAALWPLMHDLANSVPHPSSLS
jgi:sugar (pentulose or hexulose) kinase